MGQHLVLPVVRWAVRLATPTALFFFALVPSLPALPDAFRLPVEALGSEVAWARRFDGFAVLFIIAFVPDLGVSHRKYR